MTKAFLLCACIAFLAGCKQKYMVRVCHVTYTDGSTANYETVFYEGLANYTDDYYLSNGGCLMAQGNVVTCGVRKFVDIQSVEK
jgi:hypothetical protein